MEIHDVCNLVPTMSDEEYAGLKADIAANRQRVPILTYQGKIIDGRNRFRACQELGLKPKTREWDGKGSLAKLVVSLNLHRRHLTSGQRAAIAVEYKQLLAKEAKERQREAGGDKRSDRGTKAKRSAVVDQSEGRATGTVPARVREPSSTRKQRESAVQAAKACKSNERYVQAAESLKAEHPELFEKVKAGTMGIPQARQEVKRQKKRDALAAKAAAAQAAASTSTDGEPASPSRPPWEVQQGDCLAILPTLAPGDVRLIVADPPYNIGIDYGDGEAADRLPDDEYVAWCGRWLEACADALAPDGSLWLLCGHEYDWRLIPAALAAGLHYHQRITWFERFGQACTRKFNRCSRALLWFVKDPANFVLNPAAVTCESDRLAVYGDKRADPDGKLWDDVWGINPKIDRLTGTCAERLPDFPTQLPLALLRPIVGCASDPGDLVLDPFSGSGTTGVAALELGRRYLGIELSEANAEVSRQRLIVAADDARRGRET
jgi:site-specific DNA-methyltransferase (adenine-specific)